MPSRASRKHTAGASSLERVQDRANFIHSPRKLMMNRLHKNAEHDQAKQVLSGSPLEWLLSTSFILGPHFTDSAAAGPSWSLPCPCAAPPCPRPSGPLPPARLALLAATPLLLHAQRLPIV